MASSVIRLQYFVVLRQRQWRVLYGNHATEPYLSQQEAFRAAVDAAQECGRLGREAQVLVQDSNGDFKVAWTYGRNRYPPRRWTGAPDLLANVAGWLHRPAWWDTLFPSRS